MRFIILIFISLLFSCSSSATKTFDDDLHVRRAKKKAKVVQAQSEPAETQVAIQTHIALSPTWDAVGDSTPDNVTKPKPIVKPVKIARRSSKKRTVMRKVKLTPEELRQKLLTTGAAVNRPKDQIGAKKKTGLSRLQAQAGFKKVSRSVTTCSQRHASRSGSELKSAKVKISVEIMPTGEVSAFKLSPGTLRHTAFDSCLKRKRETWRFARFGGKPVNIDRAFILQ